MSKFDAVPFSLHIKEHEIAMNSISGITYLPSRSSTKSDILWLFKEWLNMSKNIKRDFPYTNYLPIHIRYNNLLKVLLND